MSDLTIDYKKASSDINKIDKLKEPLEEIEIPVIAETFPLETESSIRDSILSQPEMRQILRPQVMSYSDMHTSKTSQVRGNLKKGRTTSNN